MEPQKDSSAFVACGALGFGDLLKDAIFESTWSCMVCLCTWGVSKVCVCGVGVCLFINRCYERRKRKRYAIPLSYGCMYIHFRPCLNVYVSISIRMYWSGIKLSFIPIHSNTCGLK